MPVQTSPCQGLIGHVMNPFLAIQIDATLWRPALSFKAKNICPAPQKTHQENPHPKAAALFGHHNASGHHCGRIHPARHAEAVAQLPKAIHFQQRWPHTCGSSKHKPRKDTRLGDQVGPITIGFMVNLSTESGHHPAAPNCSDIFQPLEAFKTHRISRRLNAFRKGTNG